MKPLGIKHVTLAIVFFVLALELAIMFGWWTPV
jgi:hypothetical protein